MAVFGSLGMAVIGSITTGTSQFTSPVRYLTPAETKVLLPLTMVGLSPLPLRVPVVLMDQVCEPYRRAMAERAERRVPLL